MMKTFTTFGFVVLWAYEVFATHLLGGEISVRRISTRNNTYQIAINLYLGNESQSSVQVCLGTTPAEWVTVNRTSQVRLLGTQNITFNQYILEHTYASLGVYTVSVSLENRTEVSNMNNSVGRSLALKTTFSAFTNNQTPIFQTPAYVETALGQPLRYSAETIDADSDSLSYKIGRPSEGSNCIVREIGGYAFPNEVTRRGTFRLNARTGELIWNAPTQAGTYAAVVTIEEWRRGEKISETNREIFIKVEVKGPTTGVIPPFEYPLMEGQTITATDGPREKPLRVFPMPAQHQINVMYQSEKPTKARFDLIDMLGKPQRTFQERVEQYTHFHTFDIQALPAGVYLVRVTADNIFTQKITKD